MVFPVPPILKTFREVLVIISPVTEVEMILPLGANTWLSEVLSFVIGGCKLLCELVSD
jgi:hypothetical protein